MVQTKPSLKILVPNRDPTLIHLESPLKVKTVSSFHLKAFYTYDMILLPATYETLIHLRYTIYYRFIYYRNVKVWCKRITEPKYLMDYSCLAKYVWLNVRATIYLICLIIWLRGSKQIYHS